MMVSIRIPRRLRIGAPLLVLLGFGPFMRWKSDDPVRVRKSLQMIFAISLALGLVLPFVIDRALHITAGPGLAAALWVGITTLKDLFARLRKSRIPSLAYTGMVLAHLGVGSERTPEQLWPRSLRRSTAGS